MSADKFEQFYLDHQNDGELSAEQMAQMLTSDLTIEGDTAQADSDAPAVAAEPVVETKVVAVEKVPEAKEPEPVVLAKDGVHTIEYAKLVEAREAEQHWKKVAAEKAAELEAITKAKTEAEPPATTTDDELKELFADLPELQSGVEKMIAAKVAESTAAIEAKVANALAPIQKTAAAAATAEHNRIIFDAHKDAAELVAGEDLGKWIDAQPSFIQDSLNAVLEKGTANQVVELFTAYKASTGKPVVAAALETSKDDVTRKAQEAIAKATSAPPKSLSELPAASAAHHDEAGAIREMSGMALMQKFEGKTPDQIMDLMSRVI